MILTKELKIKTTNKNITYYKSLGFDIKSGDEITINPEQLSIGSHQKIKVSCDICKTIKHIEYKTYFKLTNSLKRLYYCNKCKIIKTENTCLEKYGVKNVSNIKEIKNKLKNIDKNYNKQKETNLKKYGVTTYLKLLPNNHFKNHNKLKKTVNKKYSIIFLNKSKLIHNDIFNYLSPYINMNTKIKIQCKICNNTFEQKPKDHIHNKQGCPICKLSKGEKEIKKYLDINNIKYEQQKPFNGCKFKKPLKFDFYLPDHNICIEFNGEQHYKPFKYFGGKESFKNIQKRDMIKESFCKENNLTLIKIKYNDDITKILNTII
ncbi:hypothetical protein [Trichloromonas sp.]|uniref:hypothetical protein n=1 Tax=Trichloromonas sp. TaxID=3069249 RepID=UPI002A3956C2|nr:hypothetical protein [Trichloromonas sp.]